MLSQKSHTKSVVQHSQVGLLQTEFISNLLVYLFIFFGSSNFYESASSG